MFLKHLVYFANDPNYELVHKWHGINILMILECLLILAAIWAAIAILAEIKGKRKLRIISIFTSIFFVTAAYAANTSLSNLSASGAIAAANLIYVVQSAGSGGVKATFTQVATYINSLFSGDFTVTSGGVATLKNTGPGATGPLGSATVAPIVTIDAQGRVTALTSATVTPAVGSITGLGTGVATALGVNTGAAGAFILFNGALGTPSSGTLTNATGLPISTGVSGLGTGIATFLATPSSANLASAVTNETGTGLLMFNDSPTIATALTLSFLTGGGTQCMTVSNTGVVGATACAGGGSVTTITPGAGIVSGITASCTQTNITVTGTLSQAKCINAQTGTTYTVLDTDRAKQVTLSNAAAIAVTLPQAGAASAFANGWFASFTNIGVGTATITPTTSTINGASSYRLFSGQSVNISSDGTNYQIDPGTSGGITVSSQTGANYAIVSSDFGKLINLSNGSNQIPTLPNANTLGANWFVQVCNQGAGTQTITPATSTIGGAATFVLPAASAAIPACVGIVGDGTNYQVIPDFNMSASYLSAGTVAAARGGAGTINGALKGNGSGVVSQAACADLSNGTALCSTTPGTGVATAAAANLSAAGGLTTTIGSGTAALGTSAITSGSCATVVTVATTNVATTDVISFTPNADITAVTGYAPVTTGGLAIYPYPTSGNVNFKVCNPTSSSITPGAVTLNFRVTR